MRIKKLDHFVITTQYLDDCLHFYHDILGMKISDEGHRYALLFNDTKINIHETKGQFQPAALHVAYGSQDFCLETEDGISEVIQEIKAKGYPVLAGPVKRHGAKGEMTSVYLRDPDGNLVELCHYEN